MSALQSALESCEAHGENFWSYVHLYARIGHVYLTPECVVLAEQAGDEDIFIWLAVGSNYLHKLCELAPASTRRLHWARVIAGRKEVKTFPFDRIKTLCHVRKQPSTPRRRSPARTARNPDRRGSQGRQSRCAA